ncbi:uncharacterized protein [Acropora muricata]|uniref:uncharacterized protein n=1 Tax=Acropora muricata TaxID=159855 RepID=UPI0034E4837A
MKDVLDDEYYQHYALLVGGIVLLSGRSISPEQLDMAGNLLIHFVEMFDAYYGARYVLMNQHMLLHLRKSVMDHGPLWSSSLFVFEDWNGDISNYFHGTQHIASQIMTAVISHQQLPQLINKMPSGNAKDIILKLQGQHQSKRTHLKDDFYAIGALKRGICETNSFEDDLQAFLGIESLSLVKYFTRLQVGAAVFHSRLYKRTSKRNTFTVAYRRDGSPSISYGQIEVFFKAPVPSKTSYGAVVVPMSKAKQDICHRHTLLGIPVTHIIALHRPNRNIFVIVPLEDIIDVCVNMEFSDSRVNYAAHFPNHLEKD